MEYIKEVNNKLTPPAVVPPPTRMEAVARRVKTAAARITGIRAARTAAAEQDGVSYKINKVDEIELRTKACKLHKKILEKLIQLDNSNGKKLHDTLDTIQNQLQEKLYAEMLTVEK